MRGMVTGDHDFEADLTRAAREQAESDQWAWSTQVKRNHEREWAQDWQYARLWRFVPRPADHSHPPFEPFGPDPLEGGGWELNVDRGDGGVETSTPAQVDVLMQLTYWRRPRPGMMPGDRSHVLSAQCI